MSLSARALVSGLSRVLAARQQGQIAGEDRSRALTNETQDRERTAMLSSLQQQLLTGNLGDQTRRRTQIAAAATRIRQNPRFKPIWDLPDDEIVAAAARIEEERAKPRAFNLGNSREGAELRAVNSQIDDTARDLTAARKATPKRPDLGFENEADSTAFSRDSSDAATRVANLRQRADSLRGVGDSLTSVIMGRGAPPRGARAPTPAQQKAVDRLDALYRNAISQGADSAAAKAVYNRELQKILQGP